MHGDFTSWTLDEPLNWDGVLFQQGRVLLDVGPNNDAQIDLRWRDTAVVDIVGGGVAAIPADEAQSFRIISASDTASGIELDIEPGRMWADGRLVHLRHDIVGGAVDATRISEPFGAPVQADPLLDLADAGTRDLVVAEVWRESISGYQIPDQLLEPALGDFDTTGRIGTMLRFRLFRLNDGESCDEGLARLLANLPEPGHLSVTLEPATTVAGDCPTVAGGGYDGLEHHLYRIEIPDTEHAAERMFKYSRFNGGLTGRGIFSASPDQLEILANRQTILRAGLPEEFYLEVLEPVPDRQESSLSALLAERWRCTFGTKATLAADGTIEIVGSPFHGTMPTSGATCFFRLWDGIDPISAFPTGPSGPNELGDGIRLAFDADAPGLYTPGDFWTFKVRAGDVENPETLIDDAPPEGIDRSRVALGILAWNGSQTISAADGLISDCRRIFRPLTRRQDCCTFRVGDGISTHGDFDTIQEAVDHLPNGCGKILVLAGVYQESVLIEGRTNVIIEGCPNHTFVHSPPADPQPRPTFRISESTNVTLRSLGIGAADGGRAIEIQGSEHVVIREVNARASGAGVIYATGSQSLAILQNRLVQRGVQTEQVITIHANDALIERNQVLAELVNNDNDDVSVHGYQALGGIWLLGGCTRILVRENRVTGGLANGVTLGDIDEIRRNDKGFRQNRPGWIYHFRSPCAPCEPGGVRIPPRHPGGDDGETIYVAGPPLRHIRVERNEITQMGLAGIGVFGFATDAEQGSIVVDDLWIIDNRITGCLARPLEQIDSESTGKMGYGAITLAASAGLVIRDNYIADNGISGRYAICGIYMLLAQAALIENNVITDNGVLDIDPSDADGGARAGIYFQLVMAPDEQGLRATRSFVRGEPAARVHDNVVSQPIGQAIFAIAFGPLSVVANQLTSHAVSPNVSSMLASTIAILNLGMAIDDDVASASYRGVQARAMSSGQQTWRSQPDNGDAQPSEMVYVQPENAALGVQRLFPNGDVLVSDNQITLDLLAGDAQGALSSVLVVSLDDVGVNSNQIECVLASDTVLFDVLLLAPTARLLDNRLREAGGSTLLSAVTIAQFATAQSNQSTHCLATIAQHKRISADNIVLSAAASGYVCDWGGDG